MSDGGDDPVIRVDSVSHTFGSGALAKRILDDVSAEIRPGEIVIMTGPSGSGKTTLLTLLGGLRSAQEGSLRVLGEELRGAREEQLVRVRRNIGYIFQSHNLLGSLTARQNVEMSGRLHPELTKAECRDRSIESLKLVGLGAQVDSYPAQLSGGQKQRVAIARALVGRPRIVLADEPTASLDKESGRDVVSLMHNLAKQMGCAILLVTHDNRILDVADRILHMEDGRLQSYAGVVARDAEKLLESLARTNRAGELTRRVRGMAMTEFLELLHGVTSEFQQFLKVIDMANDDAFQSTLEQVLEAFTLKLGDALEAERVTLFIVDGEQGELWSTVAEAGGGAPVDIRVPLGTGIAGWVAANLQTVNTADAYGHPLFNREVDARTGYRTRSLLCMPILESEGRAIAVIQFLNKKGGRPFDAEDERHFGEFIEPIVVLLESWWHMRSQQASRQKVRMWEWRMLDRTERIDVGRFASTMALRKEPHPKTR